jgi:hypothetical protein
MSAPIGSDVPSSTSVAEPSIVAGTSSTARQVARPSVFPARNCERGTPRLTIWRSVPISRSPANAANASNMIRSGSNTCSTWAAVSSPKRCSAVRS